MDDWPVRRAERDRLVAKAWAWAGPPAGGAGEDRLDEPSPVAALRVLAMAGCAIPSLVTDALTRPGVQSGQVTQSCAGVRPAVVVVPGTVPMGADELRLLARLRTPPGAVVFVLDESASASGAGAFTSAEATVPRRRIIDRNRQVLADFAPGFESCPFVFADAPDSALRAALDDVTRYAATADFESAGAVAVIDAELARRRRFADRVRADAAADEARLRKHRAALASQRVELRTTEGLPTRMTELRTGLSQARVELGHEIAARCRRATTEVGIELEGADRAAVRAYPDRLRRRLDRADGVLAELIHDRFSVATPAAASPAEGSNAETPGSAAGGPAPFSVQDPRPRSRTTEDHLMILMGASGGLGLGRLVVASPVTGGLPAVVSWPTTIVVGALIGWWIVRARAHLGERARTRQWAVEAIAEFRARWERHVAERALDVESRAVRSIGADHARASREIDRQIGQLDARIAAGGNDAARRTDRREEDIAVGERIRAAVHEAAVHEAAVHEARDAAVRDGLAGADEPAGAVDSGRRDAHATPYCDG